MKAISDSLSHPQSNDQVQQPLALCKWILFLYTLYLFFMIACSVCNTIFLCCSPADSISVIDTGNGIKIQLLFGFWGFLKLSSTKLYEYFCTVTWYPSDYPGYSSRIPAKLLICVQFQKIFRKLKITSNPFLSGNYILYQPDCIQYAISRYFQPVSVTDDCISNRVSNILFQQSITIFMDSCRMYRTDSCKHFQTRLYASERIRWNFIEFHHDWLPSFSRGIFPISPYRISLLYFQKYFTPPLNKDPKMPGSNSKWASLIKIFWLHFLFS